MADVRVSDVIASLDSIKFNPVQVQRMALDVLKKVYNGEINIVDATNPYVHCLETTAFNCTAFMIQNEATTRRLYPPAALTMEDLHLHMSDKEYPNLHATPSKAVFKILLNKAELLGKMIPEPGTGVKKIRIPRNCVFYASDIPFSLQYPIDIKQPIHGGIQISYVTDKISPLKTLTTNAIDWIELRNPEGVSFIQFEVEVDQFYVDHKLQKYNKIVNEYDRRYNKNHETLTNEELERWGLYLDKLNNLKKTKDYYKLKEYKEAEKAKKQWEKEGTPYDEANLIKQVVDNVKLIDEAEATKRVKAEKEAKAEEEQTED
jgi:hypothetical protein